MYQSFLKHNQLLKATAEMIGQKQGNIYFSKNLVSYK